MIRFLIRIAVFFGTAALGLFAARLLLAGFSLSTSGFLTAVAIFAILQAILSPLVTKISARYAPALSGGIGIVTTLIALFLTSLTAGLSISGIGTWIFGALIVWIVTAIGGAILESIFLKTPSSGE